MKYYRLTVSGLIGFDEDERDDAILHCLQGLEGGERFELAIQELEESATDIVVECEEVT